MLQMISPAWRTWLKNSRVPGLRQVVEFGRMLSRLNRMEHLEAIIEQTCARCASVETRLSRLTVAHHHLCRQVDLLKSAVKVPAEWFDEFQRWKLEHPIPKNPRVSVCVATWNRARLLTERCLPSLIRQTWPHLEIIVVGDACTDDTAERIASLGDERVRFVNLPQRGRYPEESLRRWRVAGSIPMNNALRLCTGDFVTHLDDDDEYLPHRVENLVQFAIAEQCDFVWHPFWIEDPSGDWSLNEARELAVTQVTTSSVFYRSWFKKIEWDLEAHLLNEPGDWNRFRKIQFLGPACRRYPEPLLKHYRERNQQAGQDERCGISPLRPADHIELRGIRSEAVQPKCEGNRKVLDRRRRGSIDAIE